MKADPLGGIGIGVSILNVRSLADIGIEKDSFSADLPGRAQRLDEWIRDFDRQVDGPAGAVVLRQVLRRVVEEELAVPDVQDRAAGGAVEQAGGGQQGVADGLGLFAGVAV